MRLFGAAIRERTAKIRGRGMDTLVTHSLCGYRVNYRRVLEIQARLVAPHPHRRIAAIRWFRDATKGARGELTNKVRPRGQCLPLNCIGGVPGPRPSMWPRSYARGIWFFVNPLIFKNLSRRFASGCRTPSHRPARFNHLLPKAPLEQDFFLTSG